MLMDATRKEKQQNGDVCLVPSNDTLSKGSPSPSVKDGHSSTDHTINSHPKIQPGTPGQTTGGLVDDEGVQDRIRADPFVL